MTLENLSDNATVTLSMWNYAVGQTAFSQLLSSSNGVLETYTKTNKTTSMNSISSFATRYMSNYDVRSNYMTLSCTGVPANTWTTINSSNTSTRVPFNPYYTNITGDTGSEQYGRLKTNFNLTNCTITTPSTPNSMYIIYANLKYLPPVPSVAISRLRIVNSAGATVAAMSGDGYLGFTVRQFNVYYQQIQHLTYSYVSETFSVQAYVSTDSFVVEFGYMEVLSTNLNGPANTKTCGVIS